MIRSFLRDSAVYGLATILVRALGILLVPLYTRFLAPADYGSLDILSVAGSFVGVIVALEIVQGVARFYPDPDHAAERSSIASTSLWFTVIAYGLFTILAEVLAPQVATSLLDGPQREPAVRLAVISMALNGIFYVAQSQLRWQLEAKRYAIAAVVYSLVSITASVVFVVSGSGLSGIFIGQIVGAAVGLVASIRLAGPIYHLELRLDVLRSLLAFSLPLVPASVGVYITLYVDRLVINAELGVAEVGIFGIGYRLASLGSLLTLAVQGALSPLIYAHHGRPETRADIARIFRAYLALSIVAALGLGIFAPEIIALATTPEYWAGSAVVPLLAPAILLAGMYVFLPGASIEKRTGLIAITTFSTAALNTGLNLLLVPLAGVVGAATATLTSSLAGFVIAALISQRLYPVPHRWGRIAIAMAMTGILMAVGAALPHGTIGTAAAKASLIGLAIAGCLGVGLVSPGDVRALIAEISGRIRIPRRPDG